jgi:histidine triad (HIT) family protein
MSDCVFCSIVAGTIPSYKIYEDSQYLAFLDIEPKGVGHTLVIPKKHYPYVWDMENPGELLDLGKKLAKHYQQVLHTDLVYAHIYGELVPHAHLHLVPQNVKMSLSLEEIRKLLSLV